MAITDWPAAERPRERLLTHGPAALSDAELLAIYLRVGVRGKSAVDLARDLLARFDGELARLADASPPDLAGDAGIGLAKAGYYPKFTLTGSVGSESKTLSDLFTAGAGTWSLGLGLLMPILDFGRTSARVDQAKAVNEQSLIAWQNALQTAYKEVRDALVTLRENGEAEAARTRSVAAAEQALDIAGKRYAAGYAGYLDLLDAQRTTNDARLALITTRQARLAAAVDLFKALGGGWKAE